MTRIIIWMVMATLAVSMGCGSNNNGQPANNGQNLQNPYLKEISGQWITGCVDAGMGNTQKTELTATGNTFKLVYHVFRGAGCSVFSSDELFTGTFEIGADVPSISNAHQIDFIFNLGGNLVGRQYAIFRNDNKKLETGGLYPTRGEVPQQFNDRWTFTRF